MAKEKSTKIEKYNKGSFIDSITSGAGDSLYIGWKFAKPDTIFDVR